MEYDDEVFINCPFDDEYQPVFNAIVFAVHDAGFYARSAQEADDAGESRFGKIVRIIRESKYGVHDLSRTEPNETGLPRFNMPFELGLFLGAAKFGRGKQRQKRCLVLDRDRYRYQQYISDIAGQDISPHSGDPREAVRRVRDWLRKASSRTTIPGASKIWRRYQRFQDDLPEMCGAVGIGEDELIFVDRVQLISRWLAAQAPSA